MCLGVFRVVGARFSEDIGFTMLMWCAGTCYLVLVSVPGSASATGCRCKAEAEAGECQRGNSRHTKGVLGVFGFSGPLIGWGSDQRRFVVLQGMEKAEGAGGSPGGVVRVCADSVEYG